MSAHELATSTRPCMGCGKRPAARGRYCRRCRARVERDLPTDLEDVPTVADLEALRRRSL